MALPPIDPQSPEPKLDDEDLDGKTERALQAALGGLTPKEALLEATRAENADVEVRAAATARNRERALRLLAAL